MSHCIALLAHRTYMHAIVHTLTHHTTTTTVFERDNANKTTHAQHSLEPDVDIDIINIDDDEA
jgi:hypothetical protein